MRRHLPTILLFVVLLALLALAVTFMVSTWQQSQAHMSIHGWIALGLGVFFSDPRRVWSDGTHVLQQSARL